VRAADRVGDGPQPGTRVVDSAAQMEALKTGLLEATAYLPDRERSRVAAAFDVAERAHRGDVRRSGEAYITHPVAVAELLAEMLLDADAIIAGLLHDTVEDTSLTFDDVEAGFGAAVRRIVEGETKISKLAVRAYEDEQAENLRQMLLAMVGDVRIILVKLADRLHNMRTLASMPHAKQQRIARETLEIFAPLAHRLGINHIKNELEDLSFSYLDPDRWEQLARQVRMRSAEREAYVAASIEALETRLRAEGLRFELAGRSKHLYSIHRKMLRDGKNLDQIFDLMAIRVILDTDGPNAGSDDEEKASCYRALGIVHSLWTPIPGRFKDYVAVPKPNGYQSLHTTVIGLQGQPIEVQIRSRRMHEVAEFGVAAHWAYKQGIDDVGEVQKRLAWMQQLLDVDTDADSAGAFVDAVKTDLLAERVLVFTPAGDVVNLPRGSTPLDFAYQVHTEIGHRCVGARVNGEIVPLAYTLQTGDRVEVLTNRSQSYGPSPDWLQLATTRSARQKIRHWFRSRERVGLLEAGRRILERALRRRQLPVSASTTKAKLDAAARQLLKSDAADDLLLALAAKRVQVKQVIDLLAPAPAVGPDTTPALAPSQARKSVSGVFIENMDAPAKLAQCCGPVRGDDVIGYITRGRGVTVHRVDCPNVKHLMQAEPERLVQVTWEAPAGEVFAVDFEILGVDRPGLLKDVLDVLASMNKSANRVAADVQSSTKARIHVRIDVKDQGEIEFIKQNVARIADVTRVYRSRPGLKA
jgi:GTP diphosphokinase / guanosine-3',5'-bis(diphosphate) 3'-diphosphatase